MTDIAFSVLVGGGRLDLVTESVYGSRKQRLVAQRNLGGLLVMLE
jgi:hypothetical protein